MLNIIKIIEKIRKGNKLTNDEKLLYKMVNNCNFGFFKYKLLYKNRMKNLKGRFMSMIQRDDMRFKVYEKSTGDFIEWNLEALCRYNGEFEMEGTGIHIPNEKFVVLKCSGLKDIERNLVYELDIVRDESDGDTRKIVYDKETARWYALDTKGRRVDIDQEWLNTGFKVIENAVKLL